METLLDTNICSMLNIAQSKPFILSQIPYQYIFLSSVADRIRFSLGKGQGRKGLKFWDRSNYFPHVFKAADPYNLWESLIIDSWYLIIISLRPKACWVTLEKSLSFRLTNYKLSMCERSWAEGKSCTSYPKLLKCWRI